MDHKLKCPKCHSDQLIINQKGFSGGKAALGAIVTGGIGLLAGFHGSKRLTITCLNCGNCWHWNPKEQERKTKEKEQVRVNLEKDNWEKRIIEAYKMNDIQKSESIFLLKHNFNEQHPDIHSVYKHLINKHIRNNIAVISIMIFIIIILYIIFFRK